MIVGLGHRVAVYTRPALDHALDHVRHARAITFQLAKVAVSGDLFDRILAAIQRLRSLPVPT